MNHHVSPLLRMRSLMYSNQCKYRTPHTVCQSCYPVSAPPSPRPLTAEEEEIELNFGLSSESGESSANWAGAGLAGLPGLASILILQERCRLHPVRRDPGHGDTLH